MLLLSLFPAAHAEPAYVRTPDLHGDQIVFAAVGDLWVAPVAGGKPRQLTTYVGDESQPSFSPDGSKIAYTAQYDGNNDIYVIDAAGGEPVRLTFHPGWEEVVGWSSNDQVVIRTGEYHPHGTYELFNVPVAGGEPVKLPVGFAARVAMGGPSGLWALDRIGYERRTWKRYRGGMAGDLWVGDPQKGDFKQITTSEYAEGFPMWSGDRLYYLSDQGGTADLWSVAADGTGGKRHTEGGDWDARTPSVGNDGRIVFTRAGDLHLFDPKSGKETTIAIDLEAERQLTRRRYPWLPQSIGWYTISPEGDRLLVNSRGELFSVPVDDGVVLPVTNTSGARESWGNFSPDGKRIVYVTDASGEEAILTADAWGRGEAKTVRAAGTEGWHFWPSYSPDGKRISWSDNTQTLWVAPADGSSAPKKVDHDDQNEIRDYVWSPDGRYLAYSKSNRQEYGSIWIWDSSTSTTHLITTETTHDHSPAWDPDGRYLYFASERGTNPLIGGRDFQVIEARTSRLMLVLLAADGENPFIDDAGIPGAESPVVEEKKKRKKKREREEEPTPGPKPVKIDFDGISARQIQIPVERGNYASLWATSGALFYLQWPTMGMVESGGEASLMAFDLDEEEAVSVADGASGYEIALKGEKLLFSKGGSLYVVDAKPTAANLSDSRVDLSGMVAEIEPREEWRQIYFESWRHMRDFYWDASMAGLDWKGVRDRYATLLPRISTRAELGDLLGELIGELATSHTYVWGGDQPNKVDWVSTGLLGADFVREGTAFKVTKIYRGDPADEVISPLEVPGNVVKEGEYILSINHRTAGPGESLLSLLEGKAGKAVMLTVNSTNSAKGARTVVVEPLPSEESLRYSDWVRQNREYVEKKSGGKFGYLHVPDMSTAGLVAFETWFYPQLGKEGLVVDVRWNGGGFVSQLLIERLRRDILAFDRSRGGGVYTYPAHVLNGPFVVLLNEFAGSDGDIFPKSVQTAKLAPVIGTRSWGGVIGIRADKSLVDGGVLTQPEYAYWMSNGGWAVENHGVDPDIVVQNLPQELAKNIDAQLDAGIDELTKLHAKEPPIVPTFGPAPDKSRGAFSGELGGK